MKYDPKTGLVEMYDTVEDRIYKAHYSTARETLAHKLNEGRHILLEDKLTAEAIAAGKPTPAEEFAAAVAAAVAQIRADGKEEDLNADGDPSRAAIERIVGKSLKKAEYDKAIRG